MPTRRSGPALVLLAALALCAWSCARSAPERPNVLVVVVDTLRADHLPFYGYAVDTAPFLAEWAARSVVFENAWSTSSWTAPASASLFTGVYPVQHGVHLGVNAYEVLQRGGARLTLDRVPDALETLPELLRSLGYRTFGVSDNPNITRAQGFAAGFDRFQSFDYAGADRVNETVEAWGAEIDEASPWFVYLHYMDPHEPYHPRQRWLRRPASQDRHALRAALYDSEIGLVDDRIRRVFERLGVDESTLVVFTSDHGEEFGDHGGSSHRFKLYSELLRIPFFLHQPGAAPQRIRANVSLVDLLPTLRSILGLPPVEQDAGIDLTALLEKDDAADPERTLFASRTTGMAWKRSVVRGPYKLIATRPGGNELYDLARDPAERNDLSEEMPELVEELLRASDGLRSRAPRWDGERATVDVSEEDLRRLEELGYVDREDD